MKTSQKEGVSDRPPTPVTCPGMRHRSSAGRLVSVRNTWTPYKPVRILALLPIRSPARHWAITCHRGRRRTGEQRFPKPSTTVCASVDDLDILRNRRRTRDADGLRVRSADGLATGCAWVRLLHQVDHVAAHG